VGVPGLAEKHALYRGLQRQTLNQKLRRIVDGVSYGMAPEG
jgi:hypothetical protein